MAREYAHEELYSADLAVRDAHAMGSLRAWPQARKRGWSEAPKGAAAPMLWSVLLQWAIDDLAKACGGQPWDTLAQACEAIVKRLNETIAELLPPRSAPDYLRRRDSGRSF
jgi:hypothetical protein